jgi:hypothetical protein
MQLELAQRLGGMERISVGQWGLAYANMVTIPKIISSQANGTDLTDYASPVLVITASGKSLKPSKADELYLFFMPGLTGLAVI